MKRTLIGAILTTVTALSLSGCFESEAKSTADPQPVDAAAYEPNTFHCQPEYVRTLPENKAREELVEKCMTGGSFKKSEPKTW